MAYVYTKGFGREAPAPLPTPSGGGAWQQTVLREKRSCPTGYVADAFGVCKKIVSGDVALPPPPPPPPTGGGGWQQTAPVYVLREEPVQKPTTEMPVKHKTKTKTSPVDVPAPPAELPGELPQDELQWTPPWIGQPQWVPTAAPSSSLPLIIGVAAVALLLFRS